MASKQIINQDYIKSQYAKLQGKKKIGSKLEEEKKQKKEDFKNNEVLETIGQENEKEGIKWTQKKFKEDEKKEDKVFKTELEWLIHKRKFKDEEYLTALASILWHKLKTVDWPLGYHFRVEVNGRKLKSEFTDPYKRKFSKGIKVCGIPKYDHHAVKKMAVEAENTVDRLQGNDEFRKSKGGIYLP